MPRYRVSVAISAPLQPVYDVVADVPGHGSWSGDPLTVTPLDQDRFRSVATSKGKTIDAEITVVERRPPDRFVFEATDLTGHWRHTFNLSPTAAGTLVEREIQGSLSSAQLLLYWLVLVPIKKPSARRALLRLKAHLEAPKTP